jgi:hypothetical protein
MHQRKTRHLPLWLDSPLWLKTYSSEQRQSTGLHKTATWKSIRVEEEGFVFERPEELGSTHGSDTVPAKA